MAILEGEEEERIPTYSLYHGKNQKQNAKQYTASFSSGRVLRNKSEMASKSDGIT